MDEFLASLSPSTGEQLKAVLNEEGARGRLHMIAGPYIDDEGRWPTEQATAELVAREFLRTQGEWSSNNFRGTGLKEVTLGGLAGIGTSALTGKGTMVLSRAALANYWQDYLAYSLGVHPRVVKTLVKVVEQYTSDTRWDLGIRDLQLGPEPDWMLLFGDRYAKRIQQELTGIIKQSAWQGARFALNHFSGTIGDFSEENPWVESHIQRVARNQADLAESTIRWIIRDALEHGQGMAMVADRLEKNWALSPRHAQAVERFRKAQLATGITPGKAGAQSHTYSRKLLKHRLDTFSQTELISAFNAGKEARWLQAIQDGDFPISARKLWVTAADELVCTTCRPLDGVSVPMGSGFTSDRNIQFPAAHPNCRCMVLPVDQDNRLLMADERSGELEKRLVRISEYERGDGTTVSSHLRRIGGSISDTPWDVATWVLTRGEISSKDELVTKMRRINHEVSEPLFKKPNGRILNYPTEHVQFMIEGTMLRKTGFRFGNENRINMFANRMIAGEDVFRYEGRRDPIMVLVYDDSAQMLDGHHRLAAAQRAGLEKVPIQVARIHEPTPSPKTFGDKWGELRRNYLRYQFVNQEMPPRRTEPFDVRSEYRVEKALNEWMATMGALRDESRFRRHGVERGHQSRFHETLDRFKMRTS